MDEPDTVNNLPVQSLAQKALDTNRAHQYALTTYAEHLEAKIQGVDKLLEAVDTGDDDGEDDEDEDNWGYEVQIPGAKKPTGLFPISECMNPKSPFYEDAKLRTDYLKQTTLHSMKAKELADLADAVRCENLRLQALQKRDLGHTSPSIVPEIDIECNTNGIDWNIVAEKVSRGSHMKRTADECRIKWLGERHPKINHSEWSSEELTALRALVDEDEKDGKYDWVKITKLLGTNRTPLDCMRQAIPRHRHTWSPAFDKKLLEAVEKFGINNWNLVAIHVSEDATGAQCQSRYTRCLAPGSKRGSWSPEEDERLKSAVSAYGNSWVDVSTCVPGRTNDQCRERWTDYLHPSISQTWSPAEDETLCNLVETLGQQWKAIAAKIGNGKTGPLCRQRYDHLQKNLKNHFDEPANQAGVSADTTADPLIPISSLRVSPSEDVGAQNPPSTPAAKRPRPRPIGKGKRRASVQEALPTTPQTVNDQTSVVGLRTDLPSGSIAGPSTPRTEVSQVPERDPAQQIIDSAVSKTGKRAADVVVTPPTKRRRTEGRGRNSGKGRIPRTAEASGEVDGQIANLVDAASDNQRSYLSKRGRPKRAPMKEPVRHSPVQEDTPNNIHPSIPSTPKRKGKEKSTATQPMRQSARLVARANEADTSKD